MGSINLLIKPEDFESVLADIKDKNVPFTSGEMRGQTFILYGTFLPSDITKIEGSVQDANNKY